MSVCTFIYMICIKLRKILINFIKNPDKMFLKSRLCLKPDYEEERKWYLAKQEISEVYCVSCFAKYHFYPKVSLSSLKTAAQIN